MQKRTAEEILAEIERLEALKPGVRKITAFGDNNHEAIEAQIEVLRESLSGDDIDLAWGDAGSGEYSEHLHFEAIAAADWMNGYSDEKPSDGWM